MFVKEKPLPGTETIIRTRETLLQKVITVFSSKPLTMGSRVTISHPTGREAGTVTTDHGATGRYVNNVVKMGAKDNREQRNMGVGYFDIELD